MITPSITVRNLQRYYYIIDGYGDLVRKETERAEKQISLGEERIKLTFVNRGKQNFAFAL